MDQRYLIFLRDAHSVVYFAQGQTTEEALWNYIREMSSEAKRNAEGSISVDSIQYPHPLAYIEANEKIHHEWQIRRLPDWTWEDPFSEIFCGESRDGPLDVIAECRKHFVKDFPGSRAKAFVWYLEQGTLVTFFRKKGAFTITVLKRYLWDWDGKELTIAEWTGDYAEITRSLCLMPPRWHRQKQGAAAYPFRPSEPILKEGEARGSRIVVLSADVAASFPDSEAVNEALRTLTKR